LRVVVFGVLDFSKPTERSLFFSFSAKGFALPVVIKNYSKVASTSITEPASFAWPSMMVPRMSSSFIN